MPKFTGNHGERFLFQYDLPTSNIERQRCICFTADIRILYGEGDDEDRSNRLKQHPHIIVHQKLEVSALLVWIGIITRRSVRRKNPFFGCPHERDGGFPPQFGSVRFDSSFICFLHEYKLRNLLHRRATHTSFKTC